MSDTNESVTQDAALAETVEQPDTQTADTGAADQQTEASTEAAETAEEEPKRKPWFQTRIDQLTAEKHEERRRAEESKVQREELERQVAAYKAILGDSADAETARETEPALTHAEIDRKAEELARQIVQEQTFTDKCNQAYAVGKDKHGDFEDAITALRHAGALDVSMVEDALATGEASEVLYHLGKNPEEAIEIAALSPRERVIRLDRLAVKLKTPTPAQISKAPPPFQPIDGSAKRTFDLSDPSTDMKAWMAERNKQLAKARA
jgi:hypothetical protein